MDSHTASINVATLPLKWNELSALNDDQRAFFATLCFAVSEVNALRRLQLFSMHFDEQGSVTEAAMKVQRNVLTRTLSSKLYECLKYLKCSKKRLMRDPLCREIIQKFNTEIVTHMNTKGWYIAHRLRNKAASHFDFQAVVDAMSKHDDNLDCSFFLTQYSSNSIFPFGEEVVFMGCLLDDDVRKKWAVNSPEDLDEWIDWTISVVELVNELHVEVFKKLIDPLYPDRQAELKAVSVEPDLVGYREGTRLPLFIAEEN